jgi:hypothetical protein
LRLSGRRIHRVEACGLICVRPRQAHVSVRSSGLQLPRAGQWARLQNASGWCWRWCGRWCRRWCRRKRSNAGMPLALNSIGAMATLSGVRAPVEPAAEALGATEGRARATLSTAAAPAVDAHVGKRWGRSRRWCWSCGGCSTLAADTAIVLGVEVLRAGRPLQTWGRSCIGAPPPARVRSAGVAVTIAPAGRVDTYRRHRS